VNKEEVLQKEIDFYKTIVDSENFPIGHREEAKVKLVSHELHLQLLQIQPRTIETLEVGDVIFYLNAFGQFTRNIMHGLEWIDEFKHHAKTYKFEIINIIPHQLITLMTNLVGDVS